MVYTYITTVNGQLCSDTVGSLRYKEIPVHLGLIYIFPEYTVPCNGTVVAWEFCYQRSNASSVTFYPGIWKVTETNNHNANYELVQSNTVTYNQSIQTSGHNYACQRVDLVTTDQYIAPAGSVVGLYSNGGTLLLQTSTDTLITAYKVIGNQSIVTTSGLATINYNIGIRVHLHKYSVYVCIIIP